MTTAVFVLVRTLHIGSAMMLFTLPFFILVILRTPSSAGPVTGYPSFCARLMTWLWASLILEALSGGIWFWIVAAQMNGQSPWGFPALGTMTTVLWQTQFGQLWVIRTLVGISLGVALYCVSTRRTLQVPGPAFLNWLVVVVSGCLLITLAWAGHRVAGFHHELLLLLADTPHLLIGAVWPMGLIPMAYFLWFIHNESRLLPAGEEIEALERFSQSSLIAVLLLVVTGSVSGWLLLGSWGNLLTTPYGRLLLSKLAVVAVMIGMGAVNRFLLLPRIHDGSAMFRTLRTTIVAESCLGMVVLFIVGMHT